MRPTSHLFLQSRNPRQIEKGRRVCLDVDIDSVISRLKKKVSEFREPIVTRISHTRDPYLVLISCLISLRTKDEVTAAASERLFAVARTPRKMLGLRAGRISKLIYPAGFYRTKGKTIRGVSKDILTRYHGRVPDSIDELLTLKGVGRKTANLVVTLGYGKPGICVDTHVHRISNRLGLVRTKTPEQTEFALRKLLPRRHWIVYNDLLVTYGQNVCVPISPKCSQCVIPECPRIGVQRHR